MVFFVDFPTNRIYKFSSFNEYSISALADRSAWFSKTKNLNDPFEGFFSLIEPLDEDKKLTLYIKYAAKCLKIKLSESEALDAAMQLYMEDKDVFTTKVESSIEEMKMQRKSFINNLCVFSTSVDIPSYPTPNYANMLMWSHYGNGFSGFCLQFSASDFYESLKEKNSESNIAWSTLDYVDKPITIDLFDYLVKDDVNYFKSIQVKHEQWSYEGELRFISKKEGLHQYSSNALESIYIGEKMPIGQQKVIFAIAKVVFPNTKVYIVKVHPSGYNVIAEAIKV
jgi:hypothetical protein